MEVIKEDSCTIAGEWEDANNTLRNQLKEKDQEIDRLRQQLGLPTKNQLADLKKLDDFIRGLGFDRFQQAYDLYSKEIEKYGKVSLYESY